MRILPKQISHLLSLGSKTNYLVIGAAIVIGGSAHVLVVQQEARFLPGLSLFSSNKNEVASRNEATRSGDATSMDDGESSGASGNGTSPNGSSSSGGSTNSSKSSAKSSKTTAGSKTTSKISSSTSISTSKTSTGTKTSGSTTTPTTPPATVTPVQPPGNVGVPSGTDLTVDLTNKTWRVASASIGSTISTFSGGGSANINRSATWKSGLQGLGPMAWRIPMRYSGGNPGSSANGAQTSGDAQTYIANIRSIGGTPIGVVGGDNSDNNFSNADAAGLVHYFNDNGGQHGGPIKSWIIGNEYTNGGNDPIGYQSHLYGWAQAMKNADATIAISAPAIPDMKNIGSTFSQAITNAAGLIDYLSYHAYQGRSAGLANTKDYETVPNQVRSQYITSANFGARAGQVQPSLEEFNWAPYYQNDAEFYDWRNTVFVASVIGHSLNAGARAYHYSDSNGPLGLMNDGSGQNGQVGGLYTKFPAYWGLGMWSGLNGSFRGLGSYMVRTTNGLTNGVEIFATDNGKVVLVNKDATDHSVSLGVGGRPASNSYSLWRTDRNAPTAAPTRISNGATYSGAKLQLNLPAGTVTELEI